MSRKILEQARRILTQAFLANDAETYTEAAAILERLIGVPRGERNPKGELTQARAAQKRKASASARKARWDKP